MSMTKDNKFKRTTIFLNKDTYKILKILAIELDKTVSECIEESINNYLKKHKKKK